MPIQATEEITGDIFETEVAFGLLQQWMENLKTWAVDNASKLVSLLGVPVALSRLGLEIGPLDACLGVAGFILDFPCRAYCPTSPPGG